MTTPDRFLNELFRIVTGALRLDIDKVRNYTAFLADRLEAEGDRSSAIRLRRLLAEHDHALKPAAVSIPAIPVDSESRFPLVERGLGTPSLSDTPLILSDEQRFVIAEFLSVARSQGQLEAAGVGASLTLLLHGPPGTGKSRVARFIASELHLELYVARLDGLISSYLGSTAKNIRALFEFASKRPCVLFLDEFDAIAKLRGDDQELGELKRVVNSFLQNLDALGPQTIVIAATNHEELLDRAVWRRFAYRMRLGYPGAIERREMWRTFLDSVNFSERELDVLVDLSEGFSGSDIREAVQRLKRQEITTGETPNLHAAFRALRSLAGGEGGKARYLSALSDSDHPNVARALRSRNAKLYSHAVLAKVLGVSKATSYRLGAKPRRTASPRSGAKRKK